MRTLTLALALVIVAPSLAVAQSPDACDSFKIRIDDLAAGRAAPGGQDAVLNLLDIGQNTRCFANFAVERRMLIDVIQRFESSRTDKQSGSAAGSGGSTSVVSQGPAAKVLSVAAEYGAITQSVNNQVITIRGNLAGLPSALVRHNVVPYCVPQDLSSGFCVRNSALGILRRFSFSTSFNAVQQAQTVGTPAGGASVTGQPVVFDAARNQLSSMSLRFEHGDRDASSDAFRRKWTADVGKHMGAVSTQLLESAGGFAEPIADSQAYVRWRTKHAPLLRAAGTDRARIAQALREALAELYPTLLDEIPDLQDRALAAMGAYNSFLLKQDDVIASIATKMVWAVEFINNRPTSAPDTSNVRVIVDKPFTAKHKLVANAAMTWYDQTQIDVDGAGARYRDAQVGLQYERGLGDLAIIGRATLSAAAYYQYQHAPALLTIDPLKPVPGVAFVDLPENARTVFPEKGDIILGQLKLLLTPSESSVKIPLAVTFSNRTELIAKPTWKAQIGVTYDFDSLFAR
ncbi:MAG: hypothetical protein ABIS29_08005 [Vicinamibacterales bacterium]